MQNLTARLAGKIVDLCATKTIAPWGHYRRPDIVSEVELQLAPLARVVEAAERLEHTDDCASHMQGADRCDCEMGEIITELAELRKAVEGAPEA